MSELEEDKNKKDKENRLLLIIGIILCLCSPFIFILLREYFFGYSTVFLSSIIRAFLSLMSVILFFLGVALMAINYLRKKPQKSLEGETKSYAKERIKQIGQIQRLLSRIILIYIILVSVLFILWGWMSRTTDELTAFTALGFLLILIYPFLLFVLLGGAILLILQFVKWIIKKHNKISEE